jgi:hypothetical protein
VFGRSDNAARFVGRALVVLCSVSLLWLAGLAVWWFDAGG